MSQGRAPGPLVGAVLAAITALGVAAVPERPAQAQPWTPSHCVALAGDPPARGAVVMPAAFGAPLTPDRVRIHFLGHATFLVESAAGVRIATDYNGYPRGTNLPDVVTMNHAHSTHYTAYPDPGIRHVLRGWTEDPDFPADHFLEYEDVIVRNVTTDIRAYGGRERDGNSIFIFELAGLCIGHLGHLHHEPSPAQYARIGRLDVVMVPVDGGYTMDQQAMIRVMDRVKARVVLPMHWFGRSNLARFIAGMRDGFDIRAEGGSEIEVSLETLPRDPTVVVLEPARLPGD